MRNEAPSRVPVYIAILEAASGAGRDAFEHLERGARRRAIELLESLGYIVVRDPEGADGAGDGEPIIVGITPLGTLKLQHLLQASDDDP